MSSASAPDDLFQRIEASFLRQGLMRHLGARLVRVEAGLRVVALPYSGRVTQQQGGFHGGAMSALADIACGQNLLKIEHASAVLSAIETPLTN